MSLNKDGKRSVIDFGYRFVLHLDNIETGEQADM